MYVEVTLITFQHFCSELNMLGRFQVTESSWLYCCGWICIILRNSTRTLSKNVYSMTLASINCLNITGHNTLQPDILIFSQVQQYLRLSLLGAVPLLDLWQTTDRKPYLLIRFSVVAVLNIFTDSSIDFGHLLYVIRNTGFTPPGKRMKSCF